MIKYVECIENAGDLGVIHFFKITSILLLVEVNYAHMKGGFLWQIKQYYVLA